MSRVPGCWFSLGSLSKTGALLENGYGGAIGRSFIHGGDRGLDRLRKRCFPGGRELTGKIGWIIRPCWVPTHFHQVLTTVQTGPSCLTEKEAESWVM